MSEWRIKKIGDFCDLKYGKVIKNRDLMEHKIGLYPVFSGYQVVGYHNEYNLESKEVIIVCRGVGGCGDIKWTPEKSFLTNLAISIIPNGKLEVNKDYLYWALLYSDTKKLITGSAQPQITINDLKNHEISLPSLETQLRISSILNNLNEKIEINQNINNTLEKMMTSLYRHLFIDFGTVQEEEFTETSFGLLPENWSVFSFGDVFDNVTDTINPTILKDEKPYIGLEHMPKKSISLPEWGYSSQAGSNKNQYEKFDILFGKLRPYFKKVGIAPNNGVCSTDIMVFRPKNSIYYGILLGTVIQDSFIDYCTNASSGTKMPRVNWSEIKKYPIFVPDDIKIVEEFNSKVMNWSNAIVNNIYEIKNLINIRDFILPRLMSGDLVLEDIERKNDLIEI